MESIHITTKNTIWKNQRITLKIITQLEKPKIAEDFPFLISNQKYKQFKQIPMSKILKIYILSI